MQSPKQILSRACVDGAPGEKVLLITLIPSHIVFYEDIMITLLITESHYVAFK